MEKTEIWLWLKLYIRTKFQVDWRIMCDKMKLLEPHIFYLILLKPLVWLRPHMDYRVPRIIMERTIRMVAVPGQWFSNFLTTNHRNIFKSTHTHPSRYILKNVSQNTLPHKPHSDFFLFLFFFFSTTCFKFWLQPTKMISATINRS